MHDMINLLNIANEDNPVFLKGSLHALQDISLPESGGCRVVVQVFSRSEYLM